MIGIKSEEKVRKLIKEGIPNKEIANSMNISLMLVGKIQRMITLVDYVVSHHGYQVREQVIMKLCAGFTHKEISDVTNLSLEAISAIKRSCYIRHKRKMSLVLPPLCSVCKADIDSLNDKPCSRTDLATNIDIEREAGAMFKVICDIVGLDSLCVVVSPIYGAIAKEAGQIRKRILGEENEREEKEPT